MKKITINLFDVDSIDNAIDEVKEWQKDFNKKTELFIQRLAERGVVIAKDKISDYDAIFTGELISSIHSKRKSKNVYVVVSDSRHAGFVEFGTGQVGQAHPYPYPFPVLPNGATWEYNMGSTIFEIHDGQYGWYFPMPDGTWRFTQGMESRPFMYETFLDMQLPEIIESVAKEIFG